MQSCQQNNFLQLNQWFPGHIPNQPASESIAICVSLVGFSFYETQSAHCSPNSKIKRSSHHDHPPARIPLHPNHPHHPRRHAGSGPSQSPHPGCAGACGNDYQPDRQGSVPKGVKPQRRAGAALPERYLGGQRSFKGHGTRARERAKRIKTAKAQKKAEAPSKTDRQR